MLKRLSVSAKLAVMLLPPILGLLYFAAEGMIERQRRAAAMDRVQNAVVLATELSAMVHELQKERGLSAGFLGGDGNEFGAELRARRSDADARIAAVNAHIEREAIDPVQEPELYEAISDMEAMIQQLPGVRERVDRRAVSGGEVVAYYSQLNDTALLAISSLADRTTHHLLLHGIFSYVEFLHAKERAGIERAVLSEVFTRNRFTLDAFRRYIEVQAQHDAFLEAFLDTANAEYRRLYDDLEATQAAQTVKRMEAMAADRVQAASIGIDPADWFLVATEKINGMKKLEDRMAADLLADAAAIGSEARTALWGYAITVVATLLAAFALGFQLARGISAQLTSASERAREIAAQIVATVQQQGTATNETATSVSQTMSTVDEIRQTSHMTAKKAEAVGEASERSLAASDAARAAVRQGVEAMERIRVEVENIAKNILELSEKNIQIGEIVDSVSAIAEQSNLLAVNASIEAAKAGEHGQGFAVVANEVKALAAQSKEATAQIRAILTTIQKSSHGAVMVTEQGSKRVEEGVNLVRELGQAVESLSQIVAENADAAVQITTAANQQLAGIEQIGIAMRNIEQATRDNAAGIGQLEQAARLVQSMAEALHDIVRGERHAA